MRADVTRYAAPPPTCLRVTFLQGTPLLMQLFRVFFGLPLLGFRIEAWSAAAVRLTLCARARGHRQEMNRGNG
jgi:His/Glu/Gln/Arg/opine family amino acid ABC transporter permease subunit